MIRGSEKVCAKVLYLGAEKRGHLILQAEELNNFSSHISFSMRDLHDSREITNLCKSAKTSRCRRGTDYEPAAEAIITSAAFSLII